MIKKIICLICIICMIGCTTVHTAASGFSVVDSEPSTIQSVIQLDSGDCIIISDPIIISVQRGVVSGEKYYSYKNSDGVVQWRATLSGTFSYNGSSATCTAASCVTSVQHGNWSESYNHAYPSGGTAQADVTMIRKVLFITVQTENVHLVLTCDANGNLS